MLFSCINCSASTAHLHICDPDVSKSPVPRTCAQCCKRSGEGWEGGNLKGARSMTHVFTQKTLFLSSRARVDSPSLFACFPFSILPLELVHFATISLFAHPPFERILLSPLKRATGWSDAASAATARSDANQQLQRPLPTPVAGFRVRGGGRGDPVAAEIARRGKRMCPLQALERLFACVAVRLLAPCR